MTTVSTSVAQEARSRLDWARTSLPNVRKKNVSDSERRGSLAAGALLLGYGLIRRSIPFTTLGAYLAYRGQTGRCRIYESLGVDSRAGAAGLLTTFTKAVTVNRPRAEVYRFFRDLEDPLGTLRHLHREVSNGDAGRWYVGRSSR
ncbi:MAG: YgaP-like transmembrane domain, partial [Vicinamibacteria bacterium]